MSYLQVDLEGFKRLVAEFTKAAPTAPIESLDNGFKCVAIGYLNIEPPPLSDSYEQIIALSYLDYAKNRYMEREYELIYGEPVCSTSNTP